MRNGPAIKALQILASRVIAYNQPRTARRFPFTSPPSAAGFFDICQGSPPALAASSHLFLFTNCMMSNTCWIHFSEPLWISRQPWQKAPLNTEPRGNVLFLMNSQRRTERHLFSTSYSSFHEELGVFMQDHRFNIWQLWLTMSPLEFLENGSNVCCWWQRSTKVRFVWLKGRLWYQRRERQPPPLLFNHSPDCH